MDFGATVEINIISVAVSGQNIPSFISSQHPDCFQVTTGQYQTG